MTICKPKKKLAMLLVGAFSTLASCLTFVFAASQEQITNSADKATISSKADILQRLTEISLSPNRIENAEGAPLLILSSGSKEISNMEYRSLVGKITPSKTLVSFPQVKIQNTTGQEIRSFALMLRTDQTRAIHFFRASGINLKPQDEYQVIPERWVRPENLSLKDNQREHKPYLSTLLKDPSQRAIFWSSERMWLIGNSSDIEIRVGFVEFADGSHWTMPADAEPAKESGGRIFRNVAFRPASFTNSAPSILAVSGLPSCVCSCGEYCWSQGVCDCAGNCNDCIQFQQCVNCLNNCCNTACGLCPPRWNWN
jgi:hypothetical protein